MQNHLDPVDVAIVGAGVIGLSCALVLAERAARGRRSAWRGGLDGCGKRERSDDRHAEETCIQVHSLEPLESLTVGPGEAGCGHTRSRVAAAARERLESRQQFDVVSCCTAAEEALNLPYPASNRLHRR